jgi:localization factor PodJL
VLLFRQAAELGLAACQFNVACMYRDGRGTVRNAAEAFFWFTLADRAGRAPAGAKAAQVRAQLSAAQIAVIERRLAAWKPSGGESP